MKIVNEPSNHNINDDVEYSATPMVKISIPDKDPKRLMTKTKSKTKELEEETYCCFVRGYN